MKLFIIQKSLKSSIKNSITLNPFNHAYEPVWLLVNTLILFCRSTGQEGVPNLPLTFLTACLHSYAVTQPFVVNFYFKDLQISR